MKLVKNYNYTSSSTRYHLSTIVFIGRLIASKKDTDIAIEYFELKQPNVKNGK